MIEPKLKAENCKKERIVKAKKAKLSTVAILGFQFGLYDVVVAKQKIIEAKCIRNPPISAMAAMW